MKTLKKLVAITTVISFLASCSTNEIDPSNADSQAVNKKENATAEAQGKANIRVVGYKNVTPERAGDPESIEKIFIFKPTKDGSYIMGSVTRVVEVKITHGAESDFKYITVKYNSKTHKVQRGETKTFTPDDPDTLIRGILTERIYWNYSNN